MALWRGPAVGVRCVLPMAVSLFCLLCVSCGDSFANVPSIRPTRSGETPFVQVEEFVPGAGSVNAELYAFMEDTPNPQPTTSFLQYVDAADYRPEAIAKHEDPYVAGVTVALGEAANTVVELHAHLVLTPNKTYHYRIVAENADGRFETPDRMMQTMPASQGGLPDGRAYEQVSPVDKSNLDALGNGVGMTMQASVSGSAFSFFSFEPFPVAVGTGNLYTDYRSARASSPTAWATQGVQAPIEPISTGGVRNDVAGFTEDLAKTVVQVEGRLQIEGSSLGSAGITNAYVRDNTSGLYQILASNVGNVPLLFVDASRDDSRILFETVQQLLPAAAGGTTNLYEWDESKPEGERLSLAGVLPDTECAALTKPPGCAPANGSGAGPGGSEFQSQGGQEYLQNTISEDGSKVFFTAHPTGQIYERQPLSEPSSATVPVSPGAATFLAATPAGKYVFYSEGGELYRFDTANETRQALTSGAKGVLGGLGVSDDGTYTYFVANGVLAVNKNANSEEATEGDPNLYVWHEDPVAHAATITFIAGLLPTELEGDASDWLNAAGGDEGKTSRVNPSGQSLLFMSRVPLTGYENGRRGASACSFAAVQVPCQEFFLYNADAPFSSTNPVCISCNPYGGVAGSPARLGQGEREVGLPGPNWSAHLTRNLSTDGDRVFFETAESLVSGDTNGVGDVYEWEREGAGSCQSHEGHCLYLISTGTAHAISFFGDASASGDDVFFFTRQPLVGQDRDLNFDVYDTRVGGGIAEQNRHVKVCGGEEECKPAVSLGTVLGGPGSITLSGPGNLVQQRPPPQCSTDRKLSHGRCVAIRCPKGRKLNHRKCIKAKGKKKAKGRKAARSVGRRGKR